MKNRDIVRIVAKKIGMTTVVKDQKEMPVTALETEDFICFDELPTAEEEYKAYRLGFFRSKQNKKNKTYKGSFKGFDAYNFIKEVICKKGTFEKGKVYKVNDVLEGVEEVDIKGKNKGRGFSGVMKRHNFSGLPKTHGVSATHRSGGSIGTRRKPTKVFKNKKMPGRWGGESITVKNLKVAKASENLVAVLGSTPGCTGSFCQITFKK